MKSSYSTDDVTLLLTDITGKVDPLPTFQREQEIQRGRHYSEMLPIEYQPTPHYLAAYQDALKHFAKPTAEAVVQLAHKLHKKYPEGCVLISLARAGIPAGILLKRYLQWRFQQNVPHYSISIIRGRGIDKVAMETILKEHPPQSLVFVDGWTGKGAILGELEKELVAYPQISKDLAVLADPANITTLYGTQEDILIPSACLNCTVSGLISRTFLRSDIITPHQYHGAVYYEELKEADLSNQFLAEVQQHFVKEAGVDSAPLQGTGLEEVQRLAKKYKISDINLIKPGIGEATRVLLRRVPWKILINQRERGHPALTHILQLAKEREVPVVWEEMEHYRVCGLIQQLGDL